MTEVRIRNEQRRFSALLGDVPFGELEGVIPTLKRWGVNYISDNGQRSYIDNDTIIAFFAYDEITDTAHFEVQFEEDE